MKFYIKEYHGALKISEKKKKGLHFSVAMNIS